MTDTGEFEKLRSLDRAGGEDDFASGGLEEREIRSYFEGERAENSRLRMSDLS